VGSGEADIRHLTLDYFRRCDVPGCEVHVLIGNERCQRHGGKRGTEWVTSADGVRWHWSSGDTDDDPPRTAA